MPLDRTAVTQGFGVRKQMANREPDRPTRTISLGAALVGAVLLVTISAGMAFAASTIDRRWFGWVTEDGGSHRVCGDAKTFTVGNFVDGESRTYFKGWGQTNPGCNSSGDLVAAGWLGAKASLYKDGYLCDTTGWSYNSSSASAFAILPYCNNPSGSQNWQTYASHRWWAKDLGGYAGAAHWSPVLSN